MTYIFIPTLLSYSISCYELSQEGALLSQLAGFCNPGAQARNMMQYDRAWQASQLSLVA